MSINSKYYLRIWLEMNQHPNYSDMELLDLIKPRMDYFMTLSGQFQKYDSETKQQQVYLIYQINTIQTIKELFYISSAIHDYLYKSVLMDKSVYSIFIADVPEELKIDTSSNATPLIVFHVQTNMTEIMRETLSIYNNIMPFLFQRGYFEEINDGFLAFFPCFCNCIFRHLSLFFVSENLLTWAALILSL